MKYRSDTNVNELRQERAKLQDAADQLLGEIASRGKDGVVHHDEETRLETMERRIEQLNTQIGDADRQWRQDSDRARRKLDGKQYETASALLRPEDSLRSYLSDRGLIEAREFADLRLGQIARAMVTGPRSDLERRALSEGTDSAGGYTVPTITLARFYDALRAATVSIQAGARTVPLTTDKTVVAKLETDAVAEWRSENAPIAIDDPTFGAVTFTPRSLAVIVKASRELLEDSLNIEDMIELSFIRSMAAVELDRVALLGSGTPPEPQGIVETNGVGSVDASGALTSYDKLIDLAYEVWKGNVPNLSAFVMHPRSFMKLAKLKTDTELLPLPVPPAIAGVPMLQTTSIPVDLDPAANKSLVITGDFSRLLIGMRTSLRIELLRELYAQNHQYGFVAFLRADVQLSHPQAFAYLHGVA